MHNHQPMPEYPANQPYAGFPAPDPALSPLLRMRQLATEIRGAVLRNDLPVVCQAVSLLAPTLERCKEMRDQQADSAGEAAQIAIQTQGLLNECEAMLTQAMKQVSTEIRRLQKGKKALSLVRERAASAPPGRMLDTSR